MTSVVESYDLLIKVLLIGDSGACSQPLLAVLGGNVAFLSVSLSLFRHWQKLSAAALCR